MEIDASLDKYLWEAAAWMVCKQEEQDESQYKDHWSAHSEEEQEHNIKDFLKEQEVWSPGLPILDGQVPEMELEEVVEQECWEEVTLKLDCWEEEEEWWDLEEKPECNNPLLKDTFLGYPEQEDILYHTAKIIPLARHWPLSVAFVGSEGSSRISVSHHNTSTNSSTFHHHLHDNQYQQQLFHGQDWHHQEQQHVQYPVNILTSNDANDAEYLPNTVQSETFYYAQNSQYEPSNVYLPPNNEFEHLLNIGEDVAEPSHLSYNQYHQPQASVLEPLSAPQSIYSSSSDSSWNLQDSYTSDSLSHDEILQEIHRECAQIEERNSSASPPTQAASSSKARVVRSHTRSKREEPYALQSKLKSKKQATPSKASLSPQSSRQMDSPASGGEKKKELNRIAATKYREKKRIEKESAVLELKGLEGRNTELRTQCSAIEAEIKYLKGLIKEIETRTGGSR